MNTAASHRSGRVRSRVIGGAVLVAVVLWIGTLFRGPGQGGGDGDGRSIDSGSPADPGDVSVELNESAPLATPDSDAATPSAPQMTPVLVYEDGYRLPRDPATDAETNPDLPAAEFEPATLEAVRERAVKATGNKSGIKVLVLLHASSQVGARNTLLKSLQEAGISENEIHVRDGYVE